MSESWERGEHPAQAEVHEPLTEHDGPIGVTPEPPAGEQPTVYIMIGTSAIAYEEGGEILETVDFDEENRPDWSGAGICDHRGAGPEAFMALAKALDAAEFNAKEIGFAIRRVPKERPS